MADAPTQRIVIELEAGEPIHGRIAAASEPERRFHGWLELTALLDRLSPADPSPGWDADSPSSPPGGGVA